MSDSIATISTTIRYVAFWTNLMLGNTTHYSLYPILRFPASLRGYRSAPIPIRPISFPELITDNPVCDIDPTEVSLYQLFQQSCGIMRQQHPNHQSNQILCKARIIKKSTWFKMSEIVEEDALNAHL